ncbi:TonB-dependent receptor [Sphingomonas sp. H39-1-10]|uniref:TonB-dependent receptor n=1 Tax=Sphingomonas pollutisoli TaxID=3030829 RepID=UPI0023B9C977|nr:TonB-dependent receptor [Sphingomonas pollutisoli]MDF0489753.1 TonB-dependent receptor [Sphingomonas pollutisoli]
MKVIARSTAVRFGLMNAAALGALVASAASAQTAATPVTTPVETPAQTTPTDAATSQPAAAVPDDAAQDIVVTGIRASLRSATNAKRNSVGFGDSIFAEDIGKLPATNLAETLNRIPGVRLNRDISGEGTQVAIRGLGPSFSKVLLNGSQIAVASDGGTNGGSTNREVDLDFFPSELFTRLDVSKSADASQIEGGIAGTVNLHNARPFDNPGDHVTVVAQGQYTDSNMRVSPRGAIVASHTGDTWGVLVGVSGVRTKTRVDGFETIGWADGNVPRFDANGKPIADLGNNGFSYASVVPNNAGHGLVPGAPVDLAATSGLTLDQLRTATIPRLGRNALTDGTRSRISVVGSLEWRPSDDLHFALDGIWAKSKRDYIHSAMNWYVRNSGPGTSPTSTGGMVPIGLSVDGNNVVTKGTFANSSFFLEQDIFNQTTTFWNINPSMTWKPTGNLRVDLSLNYSKSDFFREQPQFDFQTPAQSGLDVYFDNTSGNPQPIITTNRDLNDPNLGWRWYRVNVQTVRRKTNTKGAHLDLTWGDANLNLKGGFAYDTNYRDIRAFDNSAAFQTSVCGATCDGLSGSVPNSALGQYLQGMNISNFGHLAGSSVGYTQFIQPNVAALEQATNYQSYLASAPEAIGAVTGGATGLIDEKTYGGYVETNGVFQLADRDLRINAGIRYFHTDQRVAGPTSTVNGIVDVAQNASYDDFLPSFNLSYDVLHNLKVRLAASRSMTRADPGSLLPGLTFSDPSAQIGTAGNPNLKPYYSNNIDFGGEYYTGGIGYIGFDLFQKDISGFTVTQQNTVPFTSLGLAFDNLTVTQQQAIMLRGGPDVATVVVGQPVNLQNLRIRGVEATWVQPLDFLVKGLGYSVNGTHISQSSDSGLVAPGVAPWSYNLQGFYEGHGVSLSLNYVWTDKLIAANGPQSGLPASLNSDARGQFDLSAGYQLPFFNNAARLTLDVLNITNAPIRTTFGYDNATYSVYYPGRQILFGIRGKF